MTAGIHEVFQGSKFFSNAGVGEINKNLNIKFHEPRFFSHIIILRGSSQIFLSENDQPRAGLSFPASEQEPFDEPADMEKRDQEIVGDAISFSYIFSGRKGKVH